MRFVAFFLALAVFAAPAAAQKKAKAPSDDEAVKDCKAELAKAKIGADRIGGGNAALCAWKSGASKARLIQVRGGVSRASEYRVDVPSGYVVTGIRTNVRKKRKPRSTPAAYVPCGPRLETKALLASGRKYLLDLADRAEPAVTGRGVEAKRAQIEKTKSDATQLLADGDPSNDHWAEDLMGSILGFEEEVAKLKTDRASQQEAVRSLEEALVRVSDKHAQALRQIKRFESLDRGTRASERAADALELVGSIARTGTTKIVDDAARRIEARAETARQKLAMARAQFGGGAGEAVRKPAADERLAALRAEIEAGKAKKSVTASGTSATTPTTWPPLHAPSSQGTPRQGVLVSVLVARFHGKTCVFFVRSDQNDTDEKTRAWSGDRHAAGETRSVFGRTTS